MTEVDPTPELPDDTPLADVKVVSGIRSVLTAAGMNARGITPVWRTRTGSPRSTIRDPGSGCTRKKTLSFFEKTTNGGKESPIRICD
jgi:hypothetical protein